MTVHLLLGVPNWYSHEEQGPKSNAEAARWQDHEAARQRYLRISCQGRWETECREMVWQQAGRDALCRPRWAARGHLPAVVQERETLHDRQTTKYCTGVQC